MRDSDDYQPAEPEHQAYARAEAIAHCGLCDDDGMQGVWRCDHVTDFAAVAARHMPGVRAILTKKGRNDG